MSVPRKGQRGSAGDRPLSVTLKDSFDESSDNLSPHLRELVRYSFGPLWDDLSGEQRRMVARRLDRQHPQDLVDREKAEQDFRKGARQILFPRKQSAAASRPRSSRQKVTQDQLRQAYDELKHRGLESRAIDAYRLLFPKDAPLSLRAFQKRWRRFLTEIKKRT